MAKKSRTNLEASVGALEGIGNTTWFKPQGGTNVIRILPAFHVKGPHKGLFFRHLRLHRGVQIEGQDSTISCVTSFNENGICPVCSFIDHLKTTGVKADADLAKKIRPQDTFFVNLVDRATNTIKKYGMKKSMMKTLRGYLQDPDYGDITDPEEGMDVKIEKEGEGLNTRYQLKVKPKHNDIGIDDWETSMFDLWMEGEVAQTMDEKSAYELMKRGFGKTFIRSVDEPGDSDETEDGDDKGSDAPEEEEVDLDVMDRKALKAFIKEQDLDIRVTKSMSDDDIREAIEEAMDEGEEEEEEEDEDD